MSEEHLYYVFFAATLLVALAIFQSIISLCIKPRRIRRFRKIQRKGINALKSISWQEFEIMCGAYFEMKGYKVKMCGLGGADGGIDLILKKRRAKILVQCKHWRAKVGVSIVREMYGVMHAQKFNAVIIVGTAGFTKEARDWARGKPITLMNGHDLIK